MKNLLDFYSALEVLKKGGVIAYPTETFYGLGCDATNSTAVRKLLVLKGRPSGMPLSILVPSLDTLSLYVEEISSVALRLIERFWPGPLTLVFQAKKGKFPPELLAGGHTVAVRISSHSMAHELCKQFELPLTATSANPSGASPARSVEEVRKYFLRRGMKGEVEVGEEIDGILEGGILSPSKGSTLLDLTQKPPRVIREGAIRLKELTPFLEGIS